MSEEAVPVYTVRVTNPAEDFFNGPFVMDVPTFQGQGAAERRALWYVMSELRDTHITPDDLYVETIPTPGT